MNLIEELNQMKNKGRYVVSLTYVIDRLRESQRHECEHCTQIPVYEMTELRSGLQSVSKGGEDNRNLSENDRRSS
jgi:hypothetical protein